MLHMAQITSPPPVIFSLPLPEVADVEINTAVCPFRVGSINGNHARRAGVSADVAVVITDRAAAGDNQRAVAAAADGDTHAAAPRRAEPIHRDSARRAGGGADAADHAGRPRRRR